MNTASPPEDAGPVRAGKPARSKRANKKKTVTVAVQLLECEKGTINTHWRTYFLAALVETSNVTASAKAARVAIGRVYKVRHDDPEFAALWQAALAQGYDNLEMELLGYLRNPAPETKMDVAGAIRLLTLHRESVTRARALSDHRSEHEVRESLDAMIEDMRQRRLAHQAASAALDEPAAELADPA